jgi:hypothetical protein
LSFVPQRLDPIEALRFNARGPDGLLGDKSPGQFPKLNDVQRQAIARMIESGPIPAAHGVVRWRLIDLAQWIFEAAPTAGHGPPQALGPPRHHAQAEGAIGDFKKTSPRRESCQPNVRSGQQRTIEARLMFSPSTVILSDTKRKLFCVAQIGWSKCKEGNAKEPDARTQPCECVSTGQRLCRQICRENMPLWLGESSTLGVVLPLNRVNLASNILHFCLYRGKALDELSRLRVSRLNIPVARVRDPFDRRAKPFELVFD